MFGSKRKQPAVDLEKLAELLKPAPQNTVNIYQEYEYRPCYVFGRRAMFHRWANMARPQLPKGQEPGENARYFQFRGTYGVVEFEDGTVDTVWPRDITFADGGHFRDYAWLPANQAAEEETV